MAFKKIKFLKLLFAALILAGFIITWLGFGDRGFIHLYRMEKERQAYLERIHGIEQANDDLLEEIDRLREDEDYIESIARKELGLVREDEIIYRFSNDTPKKTDRDTTEEENNISISRGKTTDFQAPGE